jgi:very-short-patch-repair endonuclease
MLEWPFRGSEAVAAGLVTRGVLRGGRYRRLFPDVYVPATLAADLEVRSRAAFVWARRYGGVLGGYSSAELLAAQCAPADAPAEVVLPGAQHRPAPAGLLVRRENLAEPERQECRAVMLTTPVRTAYDLARRGSLADAVAAVDALAGRFGFAPDKILALGPPRARGRARLPRVVSLSDPRSESVMESRLRLILVLGGLPPPAVQYRVPGSRMTVDLAYPEATIAIEYEGIDHFTPYRVVRDTRRYTRLVDLGWRVYRYFAADVERHAERIVTEVGRALLRLRTP